MHYERRVYKVYDKLSTETILQKALLEMTRGEVSLSTGMHILDEITNSCEKYVEKITNRWVVECAFINEWLLTARKILLTKGIVVKIVQLGPFSTLSNCNHVDKNQMQKIGKIQWSTIKNILYKSISQGSLESPKCSEYIFWGDIFEYCPDEFLSAQHMYGKP